MEKYKIATSFLLALVIASASGVISRRVITPENPDAKAYIIPTDQQETIIAESDELASITPLLATADLEKGEKLFRQCKQCHELEKGKPHKLGPNLWNVVGAAIAHYTDYAYSDGFNKRKGEVKWNYEALNSYLKKPRKFIPGTKMSFAGIVKDQDRASVIAFLRTKSDSPIPLPTP